MIVWRISNYADLSGVGGLLKDGRWHKKGTPVIYCSETPTGAMLETLAHLDKEDIPETYQLLQIEFPDNRVWKFENALNSTYPVKVGDNLAEEVGFLFSQTTEHFDWQEWFLRKEDNLLTQMIGNAFFNSRLRLRSYTPQLAFKVPSAIMPHSWNVILNPSSHYIQEAKIISAESYPFNTRLTS